MILLMLQSLMRFLLRALLAVGTLVLLLFTLVVGALLGIGVVAWALLRGRRPAKVQFRWQGMRPPVGRTARPPFRSGPAHDVVDIEARELPDVQVRDLPER
jgi:hypothetical protein